mmetsp:Transcript_5534/g.11990  ORF Transcript_5534/g.11990 Transcript_5534/m.11990 type:complete len:140 (+) Transcript_5534:1725-2144(+)
MPTWLSASKPVKPEPKIRSGGIAKKGTARFDNMDAKYKGACCGGTRKWGDENPYKRSDGAMVYCCGACRQELPRPALTSEQMARIEANKAKALALRAAKQDSLLPSLNTLNNNGTGDTGGVCGAIGTCRVVGADGISAC